MSSNIGGEFEFIARVPGAIYDYFNRQWINSVNWLYGNDDDGWTEADQKQFEFLRTNPVMSWLMDAELNKRYSREYMDRYGITWDKVHDPRRLTATNAGAVMSSLNFVSDNVKRLYR